MKKLQKILTVFYTFILVLIIGIIRHYSGPELAFTLFFIFPVILASWKSGIWAGIIISFSSAAVWLIVDSITPDLFSNSIILYLNNIFRLIVFLIITYIVSELRISLSSQKRLARTDTLTLISNRRAFYETANVEIEKARRYGYPVSLICMDLDNFKQVNDTLGHNTGDQLLKLVAKTMQGNIRTIDLSGRLGGDEFAILLPQANGDSARIVAVKIKNKISEAMQANNWNVTTSIGLVTFLKVEKTIDDMMNKADSLMYSAKNDGKNKIKHSIV
ncbi:MAG: diguanylate cyclase [Spirochaetes bacterium]|nr:diguanylate cyclase [Spirochaetota bacterium]